MHLLILPSHDGNAAHRHDATNATGFATLRSLGVLGVLAVRNLPHAMTSEEKKQLEESIINALKAIYDPEIPVDIYELGLIYDVVIRDDASVYIKMTLTSPACPVAGTLPGEVEQKVASVQGVSSAKVEITFEPAWDRTMMSEAAQLELGFM